MHAFVNGRLLIGGQVLEDKILVFDDKIIGIYDTYALEGLEVIDLKRKYVSPGFIDIHIHGLKGHDVMDASQEGLRVMGQTLPKTGVTSYLATTMTQGKAHIKKAFASVSAYKKNQGHKEARLQGIHMEGPFINTIYKGAQNASYISLPDRALIEDYYKDLRLITFAPEVQGALDLFKDVKKRANHIKFSIGHSAATYEEAIEAYGLGVESTTHLFNGMTGFHHRRPGIVGAVFKRKPYFEIIADQIHLHTAIYDILGDAIGRDKMILITDAMCACHMAPGKYGLGGQEVVVDATSARLASGALAGSILKMNTAIKNVLDHTPYTMAQVVRMATENPAQMLDLEGYGFIKEGYHADFVVFDDQVKVETTWISGQVIYKEDT